MAVPTIDDGGAGGNTAATTHPVTVAAGTKNALIVASFRTDPGTVTPPAGWTLLFEATQTGIGDRLTAMAAHDTTDTAVDITTANSVGSSHCWWTSADADFLDGEFATAVEGTTTDPDPPEIVVALGDWLTAVLLSHSRNNDMEGFPANYTVEQQSGNGAGTSGGGTNTHLAGRSMPASTGDDPGVFSGEQNAEFVVTTAAFAEADTAVGLALATATEHDSANPLALNVETGSIVLSLATATEHDEASPLALDAAGAAVLSTAVANERDDANPLSLDPAASVTLMLATATEHDSAEPLALDPAGAAAVALATAAEEDSAQPLSLDPAGAATLALATSSEDDSAAPLNLAPDGAAAVAVASATEHDRAEPLQLGVAGALNVATTTEQDTANPLALEGAGAVTVTLAEATEHDSAQPLALGVQTRLAVATATEHDRASPLVLAGAGDATLTVARTFEWDRAFPLTLAVESLADPNPICLTVHDPDTRVTIADATTATVA